MHEQTLQKDQNLTKRMREETYLSPKIGGTARGGFNTSPIKHVNMMAQRRGDWGPWMEPQIPISTVPDGQLAVWDGGDGANGLHPPVPALSLPPGSHSLV